MMDLLRYPGTYPAEAGPMDAVAPLPIDESGVAEPSAPHGGVPRDQLDWTMTRASFSLLRDEVRGPITDALEAIRGSEEADGQDETEEAGLTDEERFIEDAYMMAKRAVRIAKEINSDPKQLIGTGDELKAKAISYIPFVLANMKSSRKPRQSA